MNIRRVCIICILIVIVMAIILTVKVMALEEEIEEITVSKEPIETKVELPVITGEPEVLEIEELKKRPKQEDVELLAKLIQAESGATWCGDEMQLAVGSVVLNRVESPLYPDRLEDVIYQPGQYSTAKHLKAVTPSERAMSNAEYLLMNGSTIDTDYLYQANFKQGVEVMQIQNLYFGKHK